jgi:GT2 family glycosyltransferase
MNKFTAIVTCKGRLAHLKETLPLLCGLPSTDVILVDYGCPEKSGAWAAAHWPGVSVVQVDDDPGFNAPRARNFGAKQAVSEYLLFVDADVKIKPDALTEIEALIDETCFVIIDPAKLGNSIRGTCIVPAKRFRDVGGYDELLKNYGMEDIDLNNRLIESGLGEKKLFSDSFDVIKHSNELRTRYSDAMPLGKLVLIATLYQEYTRRFRRVAGLRQIPVEIRSDIHSGATVLVNKLVTLDDPSGGVKLSMMLPAQISETKIGGDMEWEFELSLTMKPKNPADFRNKHQHVLRYKK